MRDTDRTLKPFNATLCFISRLTSVAIRFVTGTQSSSLGLFISERFTVDDTYRPNLYACKHVGVVTSTLT